MNAQVKDTANIKIGSIRATPNADTLRVSFKIVQGGVKKHLSGLNAEHFKVIEEVGSDKLVHSADNMKLEDIRQGILPEDLTIMILGDKSLLGDTTQFHSVKELVSVFPDSKVLLSFMDGDTVTKSEQVCLKSKEDEGTFDYQFDTNGGTNSGEKNLYRSILEKLDELEKIKDSETKLLFVFTDGKTTDDYGAYLELDSRQQGHIPPIFSIYIGPEGGLNDTVGNVLKALSFTKTDNEINGKFYEKIDANSIRGIMLNAKDSIADDYCLLIVNQSGRRYSGEEILMSLELDYNNTLARGRRTYHLGSNEHNIVVNDNGGVRVLKGLAAGAILLLLVYLIIQLLIPLLRYKNFLKKYVKQFSTGNSDTIGQSCYYCKEPFAEGDLVVAKCEHVVHKECWDENRNRCPEYGVHKCAKGIHYYNKKQLLDSKNATHYAPWILYGLMGGLLAWLTFNLIYAPHIFAGTIESMAKMLHPIAEGISQTDYDLAMQEFIPKIQSWMLEGICLGFFITMTFGMVLEFRKKDLKIWGQMLLRAMVGAAGGFLSFTIGGFAIIALNKAASCWYLDWIPWLLFAGATALTLWYKTEIDLKSALIGGALSVLLSFLFLVATRGLYSSLICYMLYAAGFGVAIAVVHFASEKYFLRIDGSIKERDIAIYKWMSVTGGFNKVSIGSSVECVLQMNWDDTPNIASRAVELYIQNDRPYCRILDKGVTQQGRTIPKDTVLLLVHGSEFSIGKTRFTYIEKDR